MKRNFLYKVKLDFPILTNQIGIIAKVSLKDFESIAFKANCFLAVAGYSQTLTS